MGFELDNLTNPDFSLIEMLPDISLAGTEAGRSPREKSGCIHPFLKATGFSREVAVSVIGPVFIYFLYFSVSKVIQSISSPIA